MGSGGAPGLFITLPPMSDDRDQTDWLNAARAWVAQALGQAADGCRRYLLGIAEKELDDDLRQKGGASDLVQETFMDAQKLFPRFEGKSEEEWLAWLRQLLLHNMGGFTRKYRTRKRSARLEKPFDGPSPSAALGNQLPANVGTPSAVVRGAEDNAALERAMQDLSEEYRHVLCLRYENDLTFEEIGQRMDRTANAARKLWVRAIHELQLRMKAAE